jgi:hypothetical protein
MSGSKLSFHGGRYGEKEPPVFWGELRQLQNSLVEAMERMFDERLPVVHGRAKQCSPTNSHGGLFGHSGQHGELARGSSFHPRVLIGDQDCCVSTIDDSYCSS